MISTDGGIAAKLIPLEFRCFDPIDEEDYNADPIDDKPTKSETVFDITGYGSDTFVEPKTEKKKAETKKPADNRPAALAEYATPQRRVALLTRPYEPTEFD